MPPELLARIDGQTVSLAACFWTLANKHGCTFGSLHGNCAVDEEQAHREFTPRQRDRDRQHREGYTIQLLTKEQWKAQAEPCFMGRCEHRTEAAA